jgi:hypothetical protein
VTSRLNLQLFHETVEKGGRGLRGVVHSVQML